MCKIWCFHAMVTKDLVHNLIVYCVTEHIVSVFQKLIAP